MVYDDDGAKFATTYKVSAGLKTVVKFKLELTFHTIILLAFVFLRIVQISW